MLNLYGFDSFRLSDEVRIFALGEFLKWRVSNVETR